MKKILILGKNQFKKDYIDLLKSWGMIISETEFLDVKETSETQVILTSYFDLNKSILEKFPKLQFVLAASSGHNYIDLKYAKKRKILVCNCPNYAKISVAEHALGLLLSLTRKIPFADQKLKEKEWDPIAFKGDDIFGKTVGIIGYGRIGSRFAQIIKPLGVKIIWIRSNSSLKKRQKLYRESDIISIHVPLKNDTYHLIGEREFQLMKEGVIIINTSRGPVIDQKSLVKFLKSGKIQAAGLDVFEKEPLIKKDTLVDLKNVILTPHIGANTSQSISRLSDEWFETLNAFFKNVPVNRVI